MMEQWEPRPVPELTPETEPFWHGAVEGEYRLQECADCETVFYYARSHCPDCGSTAVSWFAAAGEGTVYSFSVTKRHGEWPEEALPIVLARVELVEGPQVVTNVVDCDPESLAIGDPVEAVFVPTEHEDVAVPVFRPAD